MFNRYRIEISGIRKQIEAVIEIEPRLTAEGINDYDFDDKFECAPVSDEYVARMKKHFDTFHQDRKELLESHQIFVNCCEWLAPIEKIKSINRDFSTYHLKHRLECYLKAKDIKPAYIFNGSFIAAAIHLGFEYAYKCDTPSVYLNLSKKSLNEIYKPLLMLI